MRVGEGAGLHAYIKSRYGKEWGNKLLNWLKSFEIELKWELRKTKTE